MLDNAIKSIRQLTLFLVVLACLAGKFTYDSITSPASYAAIEELAIIHFILTAKVPHIKYLDGEPFEEGLSWVLALAFEHQVKVIQFPRYIDMPGLGKLDHHYNEDDFEKGVKGGVIKECSDDREEEVPCPCPCPFMVKSPNLASPNNSYWFLIHGLQTGEAWIRRIPEINGRFRADKSPVTFDASSARDRIKEIARDQWNVSGDDAQSTFQKARDRHLSREVTVPILNTSLSPGYGRVILFVLSTVSVMLLAMNCREAATRLGCGEDHTELWIVLDGSESENPRWYDRTSVTLERAGGWLVYRLATLTPCAVGLAGAVEFQYLNNRTAAVTIGICSLISLLFTGSIWRHLGDIQKHKPVNT